MTPLLRTKLYRLAMKADTRINDFRWTTDKLITPYQMSCIARKIMLDTACRLCWDHNASERPSGWKRPDAIASMFLHDPQSPDLDATL